MRTRASVEERCLLYLLDRADVREDSPVAQEIMQDRIGEALALRRSNISRAMGVLKEKGYVKTAKVHLRGVLKRRLLYFLTDSGFRRAKELRRRFEEFRVTVVDAEGKESKKRLYEVYGLLPRKPKFSDLVASVERRRLDLRQFLDRQAHLHSGKAYDVREAISTPHFQGRVDEINRLNAFLSDERARAFLLVGLPGIGKTALASRWVANLRGRMHVVWRRVRPETTVGDVLRDLAATLHSSGRPALSHYLHRPRESGRDVSVGLLKRELSNFRALLVLDDAHTANREVSHLLGELLDSRSKQIALKILLLGRERVKFCRAENLARGIVWEKQLDDLSRPEAKAMLVSMGVDSNRHPAILDRFGGHPLSLELAAAGGMPLEGVRRISASVLIQEVLPQLDPAARDALDLAAAFEEPIPLKLLGSKADELLRLCLLREEDGGRVGIHDMVREAVVRDLTSKRIDELHVQAGKTLARGRDPREALAAMRHFASAGAFDQGGILLAERGEDIIAAGYAEALLQLLDQNAWTSSDSPLKHRILLLKGHTLFALGRWNAAARAYEKCSSAGDEQVAAEAFLGQGKAGVQRQSRLALSLLIKARSRLEGLGLLRLLAEAQYWIGGVYEDAGHLDDAREAFERGKAVAFDIGDRRWEGLCTYGIGRLKSLQRNHAEAADDEKEALRLLEREGHRLEIAKVCTSLGGDLLELGFKDDAEHYLARGVAESRAIGALGILAPSLYNLANLQKESGRMREATPLLEEALSSYEEQEQYDGAAQCAAWLAFGAWTQNATESGDSYAKKAMSFLSHVTQPALRANARRHLARAAAKAGRLDEACRQLELAVHEAHAAESAALEADLQAELKKLS